MCSIFSKHLFCFKVKMNTLPILIHSHFYGPTCPDSPSSLSHHNHLDKIIHLWDQWPWDCLLRATIEDYHMHIGKNCAFKPSINIQIFVADDTGIVQVRQDYPFATSLSIFGRKYT